MAIETDIKQALFDRVTVNAIASWLTPALRVRFPDVVFKIPENGERRYLDVKHFPIATVNYDLNDKHQVHAGTFQVTLVDPTQLGEIQASEVTAQIVARFAKDTAFAAGALLVKIMQTPALLTSIEDGRETLYPVSIRYRCSV